MSVRVGGEDGSGSVAAIGAVLAVVLFALMVLCMGSVYRQKQQVQAVADMAAIAGGQYSALEKWVSQAEKPCARAQMVVEKNSMTLAQCFVQGGDTYVHIVRNAVVLGVPVAVHGYARAGESP